MTKFLTLLRVEQWVKNLFVFLPLFFSGNFLNPELFLKSCLAFVIFSLASSIIYIVNDYIDAESDRQHPEKKNRPIASGSISKRKALGIGAVLAAIIMIALFMLSWTSDEEVWKFTTVILAYLGMNIAYTFRLKHVAIIDVCLISIGFVLRVMAGGYMTEIPISQWAIILTFVLALVLALGKRRGELINAQISGKTRRSLDGYNVQFADIALSISVTLAIISYLMFTVQPEVHSRFGNKIFYTFIFVVFAFLRYLQQTLVHNRTESPTKIIYKDRYIQATLILWVVSYFLLIYYKTF